MIAAEAWSNGRGGFYYGKGSFSWASRGQGVHLHLHMANYCTHAMHMANCCIHVMHTWTCTCTCSCDHAHAHVAMHMCRLSHEDHPSITYRMRVCMCSPRANAARP